MLADDFQPKSILLKRELIAYKLSCASDNYTKALDKRSNAIRGIVSNIEKKKINHDGLMRDYVRNVERMSKDGGSGGGEVKLIEKIMMEKVNEEFCGGKGGVGVGVGVGGPMTMVGIMGMRK
jgi:hypothetical protein